MTDVIRFSCPECGKALKARAAHVRRKARCECGHVLTIPASSTLPADAPRAVRRGSASRDSPAAAHPVVSGPVPVLSGARFDSMRLAAVAVLVAVLLGFLSIWLYFGGRPSRDSKTPAATVKPLAHADPPAPASEDLGKVGSPEPPVAAQADPSSTRSPDQPVARKDAGPAPSPESLETTPVASRPARLPQLQARMSWSFTPASRETAETPSPWKRNLCWHMSGSDGPRPKFWPALLKLTLELENTGDAAWTILPEMFAIHGSGTAASSHGIISSDRREKRNTAMGSRVESAPKDDSGLYKEDFVVTGEEKGTPAQFVVGSEGVSEVVLVPAGAADKTMTTMAGFVAALEARWRVNGKDSTWEPATLRKGGRAELIWTFLLDSAYGKEMTTELRSPIICLGPVAYRGDESDGVASALASTTETPKVGGDRAGTFPTVKFLPLTEEVILAQMRDASRPDAWREQFMAWLWDQPRPAPDPDRLLMSILGATTGYTGGVRAAAAKNLGVRRHRPAAKPLAMIARDRLADKDLRRSVLYGLHLMRAELAEGESLKTLAEIARDIRDDTELREYTLLLLKDNYAQAGWSVIDELTRDPEIGAKAKEMLAERKKDK